MRHIFALLLCSGWAQAGVVYDLAVRPVDQSNLAFASPNSPSSVPAIARYFVEDGKVRIGGANAKTVYVFKDRTMYVIDNTARVVHVLKHATLSQVTAHYADAVKQLEDAAAKAPAEDRAAAEQKAADLKIASDRIRQPVPREYRVTVRFESVDGHACRIWEEYEKDAKRLELCIAPLPTVAGGTDIMAGLKTLSQFRQGSDFAFGVDFVLSEWWSDISLLGGVPLLVREYKYDSQISEVMLSAVRQGPQAAALFEPTEGYQIQEGPDYAQWFVR